MTYGVNFSGHKDLAKGEEVAFAEKVEAAAAAGAKAFRDALGDDAGTVTSAGVFYSSGALQRTKNLLTTDENPPPT